MKGSFAFLYFFLFLGLFISPLQSSKTLPDKERLKEDELIDDRYALASTFDFVERSTTDNFIAVPVERTSDGRFNVHAAMGTPVQALLLFIDTTVSSLLLFNYTECTLQWKCFDFTRSSSFHYCSTSTPSCPQKSYCRMGNDYLYFNVSGLAITDHFPACISYYHPGYFRPHPNVAGMLGLANNAGGLPALMTLIPRGWPWLIAMDFNAYGKSNLYLGGYNTSIIAEPVEWSESQIKLDAYHWFPNLIDSVVAGVLATDAPCLSLPATLFKKVIIWSGAVCDESLICRMGEGTDEDTLPELEFTVSPTGNPIRISLADLLVGRPDQPREKRLCMTRAEDDRSIRVLNKPAINIGTLAMNSILAILDGNRHKVGFANKQPRRELERCPRPAHCKKGQIYNEGTNSCDNPKCSIYWFQTFDEETTSCKVVLPLKIVVAALVIILGLGDVILTWLRVNLFRRILALPHINVEKQT